MKSLLVKGKMEKMSWSTGSRVTNGMSNATKGGSEMLMTETFVTIVGCFGVKSE